MKNTNFPDRIKIDVEAKIIGPLAIHTAVGGVDGLDITHIKSGFMLRSAYGAPFGDYQTAVASAEKLRAALPADEWETLSPSDPKEKRGAIGLKLRNALHA